MHPPDSTTDGHRIFEHVIPLCVCSSYSGNSISRLGNSYFHSRIISWGQMWCFLLQFSWTGYIFVKNFKKLILTFWRVGFDSIYFQTANFIGKRISFTPSNSIISLSAAVAFLLKNEVMSGAHNRGLCSTKAANTVTDTD